MGVPGRLRGLLGSAPAYDDYADDDDDENIDAWVFVVLIVAILVFLYLLGVIVLVNLMIAAMSGARGTASRWRSSCSRTRHHRRQRPRALRS